MGTEDEIRGIRNRTVWIVGIFDLVIWLAAVVAINRTENNDGAWLAAALGVVGIASFFGFFLGTGKMRLAIAAALTVVYVALISHLLLIGSLREAVLGDESGKTIFQGFTGLVGTVVTFYVGSSAAVRGVEIFQEQKTEQEKVRAKQQS